MGFTVQNNNLLYSVSFTEETPRIGNRDLSNGLFDSDSVITLLITVWHIIEHQRQQFDRYRQGQIAITEIQLGTHAMGHEVAFSSGHHYSHFNGSNFPINYVAGSIQYTLPLEERPISKSWVTTREVCQVSRPGIENNFLQIVSRAHSRQQS